MTNLIVIGILAVILGLAGFYVLRAKKKGTKCIGCPDSGNCSGNCSHCGNHRAE